jgi:hypothetical protein
MPDKNKPDTTNLNESTEIRSNDSVPSHFSVPSQQPDVKPDDTHFHVGGGKGGH